jgi:hypothetical protein
MICPGGGAATVPVAGAGVDGGGPDPDEAEAAGFDGWFEGGWVDGGCVDEGGLEGGDKAGVDAAAEAGVGGVAAVQPTSAMAATSSTSRRRPATIALTPSPIDAARVTPPE